MIKKIITLFLSVILVSSTFAGQTKTDAQQESQEVATKEKNIGSEVLKDLLVILILGGGSSELSGEIEPFEGQIIYVGIFDDIFNLDFKEYGCLLRTEHNIYMLGVTPKYSGVGLRFVFSRPKGKMGIAKTIQVSSDIHLKEAEQLQLVANDNPEPFSLFTRLVNDGKKEFKYIKEDQSKLLYRFGRPLYRMNCKKTEK